MSDNNDYGSHLDKLAFIILFLSILGGLAGCYYLWEEREFLFGLLVFAGSVFVGWGQSITLATISNIWKRAKNIESSVTEKTVDDKSDDVEDEYTGSDEAI